MPNCQLYGENTILSKVWNHDGVASLAFSMLSQMTHIPNPRNKVKLQAYKREYARQKQAPGRRKVSKAERTLFVTFPPHVTSTSAIEKGKWLEWRDMPERTDSSGSNGLVMPDLDLDKEESFIVGRLVSADVIKHKTDHAPDYGDYGVMSGRLALS
jgi:hypothetical protein